MGKAVLGVAELAGAVGMGVAAFYDPALVGSPMFDKIMTSLVMSGISSEAGAIANALTTNRGIAETTRQPAANQQIIYGQQRTGGVIIKQRPSGSSDDQMNYVIVLAGHECQSIQNLYLDGRQVHWLGSGGGFGVRNGVGFGGVADNNSHTGPNGVQYNFGGTGHSGIYCEARYGDQLDGDIIGALTANCPEWAGDGKGSSPWVGGCTYVYLKIEYNTQLFPNEPEIRFTVNGKNNIWDPRTQTYGYTNNWALVAADIITDPIFGLGDNKVNQLNLIAAANICDEQVQLAAIPGADESRYTCNYHYDTSVAPGDALQAIMPGAGAGYSQIGGEYYLWPAVWQGSSFSFDGSHLTAPFQWSSYRSVPDRINRVNGTYIAPTYPYNVAGNLYDQNGFYNGEAQNNFPFAFQPTSFPQFAVDKLHGYPSDEWLTADGGTEHPYELTLSSVLSITQAQRLAKIVLMRNRFEGTAVLEMNLSSYVMQPKDVFEFTFAPLNWTNHLLEVTKVDFAVDEDQDTGAQSIRVRYTVIETDPSIYDWTPNAEELTVYDVPASPNQAPPTPTPPTNMTLESGPSVAQINPDGTVNNIIQVNWDTPLDNLAIGIQIQYRVSGTASWIQAPSQGITLNTQWISNAVPGTPYDVRISSYRANGQVSDWVEQDGYVVINTPTDLGTLAAQLPVISAGAKLGGTAPGEMLTNGNFASYTISPNVVNAWQTELGSASIDTSEFRLGLQSLAVNGGFVEQDVNLIAGHTYQFQAWCKASTNLLVGGAIGGGICVRASANATTIQKGSPSISTLGGAVAYVAASGGTDWIFVQLTFTANFTQSYGFTLSDNLGGTAGVGGGMWFDSVSLTDTSGAADVTSAQPIVYTASSQSIVPNGNFVLGNMDGWDTNTFAYYGGEGINFNTPAAYTPPNVNAHAFSQSFQVVPGSKYRLVYSVYSTLGSGGGIYLRIATQSANAPNVDPTNSPLNFTDFLAGGNVDNTAVEFATYDWVAPAGANYASMCCYAIGGCDLAIAYVACYPYVATSEWGANVTGNNTSNDTKNVGGVPSSVIASVVPTGFKLEINSGARLYSLTAI